MGRGKGGRRRYRSGGGPPAWRNAHGQDRHPAAQRICARWAGQPTRRTGGGWNRPPREGALLTATVDGVSNRRRAAATEAGAQARSSAGYRERFEPRNTLRVVAACNSGRWGGAGGHAPSGPCDPCGGAVLLSNVTPFAFSVIASLPTLTRPQIPEDTNANCHL